MRLWCDVFSAAGARLGEGAIQTVKGVDVSRVLDGAGTINFSVPLNDDRAIALLVNEARVRLYAEFDGTTRELGRGIIRNRSLSQERGGKNMSIQAIDDLDLLKRYNTFLGHIYMSQTAQGIASGLAALAGWTVSGSGGATDMTARFDGATVLKALQELCEHQGLHLRLGDSANVVEIGAFGDTNALVIMSPSQLPAEIYANTDVALIEKLIVGESSEAVANVLVPLGQGAGESALTLEKSTRATPYTIQTMTPNGKTHYYLQDDTSVALYGTIQKVGTYRQIGAVSNSDADLENAANALYDAAANWLQRYSQSLVTYECTIRKARQTIKPGQKIRLVYQGLVYNQEGVAFDWVNVDGLFWVMEVRESFDSGGHAQSLKLATVDRVQLDAAQLVVGALDAIELHNTRVQTYPSVRSFVYRRELDATHSATIPVLLTETTTALNRAILQLATRAFRVTATAAASGGGATSGSGGGSTVTSASGGSSTPTSSTAPTNVVTQTIGGLTGNVVPSGPDHIHNVNSHAHNVTDPGHAHSVTIPSHTHDVTIANHTHTVPNHTHALDYGIADDSETPDTVSVWIDGADQTTPLGGPWGVGGGAISETLDITSYLVNAAGGLRQQHTVEIKCASGQGEVEATVECYETIQSISVL